MAYEDELVTDVLARLDGASAPAIVRSRDQDAGDPVGILAAEDITRAVATVATDGRGHGKAASRDDDASQDRVLS